MGELTFEKHLTYTFCEIILGASAGEWAAGGMVSEIERGILSRIKCFTFFAKVNSHPIRQLRDYTSNSKFEVNVFSGSWLLQNYFWNTLFQMRSQTPQRVTQDRPRRCSCLSVELFQEPHEDFLQPCHQKSTRLTQSNSAPYAVQIWSRYPPKLEGTPSNSTVRIGAAYWIGETSCGIANIIWGF